MCLGALRLNPSWRPPRVPDVRLSPATGTRGRLAHPLLTSPRFFAPQRCPPTPAESIKPVTFCRPPRMPFRDEAPRWERLSTGVIPRRTHPSRARGADRDTHAPVQRTGHGNTPRGDGQRVDRLIRGRVNMRRLPPAAVSVTPVAAGSGRLRFRQRRDSACQTQLPKRKGGAMRGPILR